MKNSSFLLVQQGKGGDRQSGLKSDWSRVDQVVVNIFFVIIRLHCVVDSFKGSIDSLIDYSLDNVVSSVSQLINLEGELRF